MKNFLTLIGANVPTASVCTAKSPQNAGGGNSQSFTLRSIGAQYFTCFLGSSCRVWKYVACMLLAFFVGVGNVWGDVIIPSETLTLPTTNLGNWDGSKYSMREGGATTYIDATNGYIVFYPYAVRMSSLSWAAYETGNGDYIGSGTGTWNATDIFKGNTYWNIGGPADEASKYRFDVFKKEQNGGYCYYRVKNCTGVKIYYKSSKGNTTISLKVYEISGEPGSEIATEVTAAANSASSTSAADGTLANKSTLDKDKEYLVEVHAEESKNGKNSDNVRFYEIAFYYLAEGDPEPGEDPTPTCTDATVSFSATSTAIEIEEGESSASTTLSFTSDNESTAVYTVTKGGEATSDASVSAGTFTATAAGTYVVTVTQAKDDTNSKCAVEETVTITVTDANGPKEVSGIKMIDYSDPDDVKLTGNFLFTTTLTNCDYTIEGLNYKKYVSIGNTNSGSFSSNPAGLSNRYIMYAVRNKTTKFNFYVHNEESSAEGKIYIYTVPENPTSTSSASLAATLSIDATKNALKTYELTTTTNTAVFIAVSSKKVHICQIVAQESGDAHKQGGEIGYSINFNKGRLSAASGTAITLEGIEYKLSSGYTTASSTEAKVNTLGTHYIKFNLPAAAQVNITTSNNATYYVSRECSTADAAKTNATSYTGKSSFVLDDGIWYINGNGNDVKITKLEFVTPPTKYNVTYTAGTGSVKDGKQMPTQAATIEGGKFNLASGDNLEKTGYDFNGWQWTDNSEVTHDVAAGTEFTMPGYDVTFVAQWTLHVAQYTVTYKDGTEVLKSVDVNVGSAPAAYTPTKDFYTFASWNINPASLATSAIEGDEIVLTANWTAQYTSGTYEFTGNLTMGSAPNQMTIENNTDGKNYSAGRIDNIYVSAQKIGYEATGNYAGWKLKTQNGTLRFMVENVCGVRVTLGEGNPLHIDYTDGGVAKSADIAKSTTSDVYKVDANSLVTLKNNANSTVTLKKIEILPLYKASYVDETGDGEAGGDAKNVTEVTLPTPSETTVTVAEKEYTFTGWTPSTGVKVGEENKGTSDVLTAGTVVTLLDNTTFTAQWQEVSDFDVKFFPGYGENTEIGTTQKISTGAFATAPTDPTRTGYKFLGWSYDATEAHIVNVAEHAITVATSFTAIWKQVWTVTFDGAGSVEVENGEKVASSNSPSQAGKVFQGWYNAEVKYDFSAAVTGNLALTSKWADADPNHYVYAYNDDFHFDGVVYKTPEGKVAGAMGSGDVGGDTYSLTTPYTLFSGEEGITSIIATKAIYDSKNNWVNAYLKINNSAESYLTFIIKTGYTAVLKMKMGGYSADPTITLKKGEDVVVATSGEPGGKKASIENNFNEFTYELTAGTYTLTTATKTLYISHIDLEAEAIPAKTVIYHANNGTSDQTEDNNATEIATCSFSYTGHKFIGWTENADGTGTAHAVGAVVGEDLELYAQWVEVFAVTFNLNGQSGSIAAQSVEKNGTATKPADPVVIGQEFGGWYTSSACADGDEFDFNTAITEAKELFAKWTAFDGCVMLYPATSGDSPANEGDEIAMQTGSEGATMTVNTLSSGELNYTAGGLQFAKSGSPKVNVTLNSNTLKAGSVISLTLIAQGTTNPRGLYLNTADGVRINAFTCWVSGTNPATNGAEETFTYTVVADDGLDGTNAFQLERNNTVLLKKLTIKNCGAEPVTVTFKKADDTQIAEKVIEKGSYVTAPAAPRICGSRLTGWSETVDGELVDLATTAINADKTFYPVYAVNTPVVSGTVYKFQLKTDLTSGNMFATAPLPATAITTENFLSELVGGELEASNTNNNNNRIVINDKKAIGFSGGDGGKLTLYLNEPLKVGDEIRFINYASSGNSITLSDGTNNTTLNGNGSETVQTFSVPAAWEATGSCVLTMVRGSNTAKLTYFEIYRRPVLTGVSLNELTVRVNAVANPEMTLTPSNDAIVTNQAWSIVSGSDKITIDATGAVTGVAAGDAVIKVVLNEDEENFSATATVHVVNDYARQDVTGSMEWNWANSGPLSGVAAHENNNVSETLLANIGTMPNNAEFRSDMLVTTCQHAYRKNTGNGCWQGTEIKFYTTVPGAVKVNYMGTGSSDAVTVSINNWSNTYTGSWTDSKTVVVPAGWVAISASESDKLRIKTITFTAAADLNPAEALDEAYYYGGYTRNVTEGRLGTICLPNGGIMVGASLYEIAYMNYKEDRTTPNKIYFDEIPGGVMVAGMPYIFFPNEGATQLGVYYTDAANAPAGKHNGLYGTLTDMNSSDESGADLIGNYIFNNNMFYTVTPNNVRLAANRAYVKACSELPGYGNPGYRAAPAKPGRRRISTGFNAPQIATGLEDAAANEKPVKVLINGEMFIIRGEKMYDATGRLVK